MFFLLPITLKLSVVINPRYPASRISGTAEYPAIVIDLAYVFILNLSGAGIFIPTLQHCRPAKMATNMFKTIAVLSSRDEVGLRCTGKINVTFLT